MKRNGKHSKTMNLKLIVVLTFRVLVCNEVYYYEIWLVLSQQCNYLT